MDTKQLSMLEVALELLTENEAEMSIVTLIEKVLELKELEDPNGYLATQLYTDITTSSLFVFVGEGKWDLKSRQSLEVYGRDGSFYSCKDEEVTTDDNNVTVDDFNVAYDDDEYKDYDDDDDDEYDDYYDYELGFDDIDPNEDDDEVSYLDEQEYNDIMDDYEDMYEDN